MLGKKYFAPAKVNLFLRVNARADSGYHDIQSIFMRIDHLYDELIFSESLDKIVVNCDFPDFNNDENSIIKAIKLIKERYKIDRNIAVNLKKTIPIGAGLGGGSSDAAATIFALSEIWNLNLPLQEQIEIANMIGYDVIFFLYSSKFAIVSGFGEKVIPTKQIELQKRYILLIYPNFVLSTQSVYHKYNGQRKLPISLSQNILMDCIYQEKNDLYEAALELCPQLKEIIDNIALQHGCEISRMSGSGSTCFGLFKDQSTAQIAKNNLLSIYPQYFIEYFPCDNE